MTISARVLHAVLLMAVLGLGSVAIAQTGNTDYSSDDSLIDVRTAEQLNAIRWDLNGNGVPTQAGSASYFAAFPDAAPNMGCTPACTGYALRDDIDLGVSLWSRSSSTEGWEPIGSLNDPYAARFDGADHVIKNLFINRSGQDYVGLFGRIGPFAKIERLGLSNAVVTGNGSVGGLAGRSDGEIRDSYAVATVSGNNSVGGLVGYISDSEIADSYAVATVSGTTSVGGLAGAIWNSEIAASYAVATVSGSRNVGGLAGYIHQNSEIAASYAVATVSGSGNVGGLAGYIGRSKIAASYAVATVSGGRNRSGYLGGLAGVIVVGEIAASYAVATVSGSRNVGGLMGNSVGVTISNSYWDTDVSGLRSSAGGVGKTTIELQTPTAYRDIYAEWNVDVDNSTATGVGGKDDPWHFGTDRQYPVLQYGGLSTATQFAMYDASLRSLSLSQGTLAPAFASEVTGYTAFVDKGISAVTITATAAHDLASIAFSPADLDGDAAGHQVGTTATVTITVTAPSRMARKIYTLEIKTGIDYSDDDELIDVRTAGQLNAMRWDLDGDGVPVEASSASYFAAFPDALPRMGCASTCTGYVLRNDIDLGVSRWSSSSSSITGWEPIGRFNDPYAARFDGADHVIKNLFINRSGQVYVGLFGRIGPFAKIERLGLSNAVVTGRSYVGGLVGWNDGEIIHSHVTTSTIAGGSIGGSSNVGGLVGGMGRSEIAASYAVATVSGDGDYVGGLVGSIWNSEIAASYAVATVSGDSRVGGLVGRMSGSEIAASYAVATVSGDGDYVGGLVGQSHGTTITDSYAVATVSGDSGVGGLVGAGFRTTISNSYWDTDFWDTDFPGLRTRVEGVGKTSSELRTPTTYTGIYAEWNVDVDGDNIADAPWDFGTVFDYPVLVFGGEADTRQARRTAQQQAQPGVRLTPTLSGDAMVSEGAIASYVVSLPMTLPAGISASWSWAVGGTGIDDRDVDTTSGVVVIAPGRSSASFSLSVLADGVAESDEVMEVSLSAPRLTGAPDDVSLGVPAAAARTTIEARLITVSAQPALMAEGGITTFMVVLAGGVGQALVVEYEITAASEGLTPGDLESVTEVERGGTSSAQVNTLPLAGSVTLRVDGTAQVSVRVASDDVPDEGREWFRLRLTRCANCGTGHTAEIGNPSYAEVAIADNADYSSDDSLIDVRTAEQLNAMRWDLDGDGVPVETSSTFYYAAFPGAAPRMGCASTCTGYALRDDIDLGVSRWSSNSNITGWAPIGGFNDPYDARFDGADHVIKNLFINRRDDNYVGLFGRIGPLAKIERLGLSNAVVTGNGSVGGLAGRSDGEIIHSHVTTSTIAGGFDPGLYRGVGGLVGDNGGGEIRASYAVATVSGVDNVGGLVGQSRGTTITDSYAVATVNGRTFVGGLAGYIQLGSEIADSYAVATVSGDDNVGGLAGFIQRSEIAASYAVATVSGDDNVGGLAGFIQSNSEIADSYAVATVSGDLRVGGLAGYIQRSEITDSYAVATVSGNRNIGGLAGDIWNSEIAASYAVATVSGTATSVGGLAGSISFSEIAASYAVATVSGDGYVGGLAGYIQPGSEIAASYAVATVSGNRNIGGLVGNSNRVGHVPITISNSYWDTDVSGLRSSAGGVGKTTIELQTPTTYRDIYAEWNVDVDNSTATGVGGKDDPWHFGTDRQYPVLQYGGLSTATQFAIQNNDASLRSLSLSQGTLAPAFASEVTGYTAFVNKGIPAVTITATAVQDLASIAFSPADLDAAAAGHQVGTTATVTITVTAPNRIIRKIYTLEMKTGIDYSSDDELIDVRTAEQLNAMRWDLDGDGVPVEASSASYSAAFPDAHPRMGCASTCTGYVLRNDIDLGASRWSSSSSITGWAPIGGFNDPYDARFDGADHVIKNLFINRRVGNYVGLFGRIGPFAKIERLGLSNAVVTGSGAVGGLAGRNDGEIIHSHVTTSTIAIRFNVGHSGVGGLVGVNEGGEIADSYAVATVSGDTRGIGGLVGWNTNGEITASYAVATVSGGGNVGGLVGYTWNSEIAASYAVATVSGGGGEYYVGGLVGRSSNGEITASYAVATVSGDNYVGGLVGSISDSEIAASYAVSTVSGRENVGGLVGTNIRTTISNSYWDTDVSGLRTSAGGTSKTSSELRTPTSYTGIYSAWNVDVDGDDTADAPWDFGTVFDYPVLVFGGEAGTRQARRTAQQQAQPGVRLTPTLSGDATVLEGDTASYVVDLPMTLPAGISASWSWVVGGTGIDAMDVATTGGSVVIAPGRSSASFSLSVLADGVAESDEVMEVSLSAPRLTGAPDDVSLSVPATAARTTIAANELRQVTVSAQPTRVAEGGITTFTVTLAGGVDQAVVVEYEITTASEDLTPGDLDSVTEVERAGTTSTQVNALPVTGSVTLRTDGTAQVSVRVANDIVSDEESKRFQLRLTRCANCGAEYAAQIGSPSSATVAIRGKRRITVAARVYLQGAYDAGSGNLRTSLTGLLPRRQPYGVAPWNYPAATTVPHVADGFGLSRVTSTIVDWVLVELRSGAPGAGAAAVRPTAGGRAAGLLLSDGRIAGINEAAATAAEALLLDGPRFEAELPQGEDVYVLIHHRNHLPVMSAQPATNTSVGCSVDYCADFVARQSRQNGQYAVGNGVFAMFAGNADRDNDIDADDENVVRRYNATAIISGAQYTADAAGRYAVDGDLDFDGDVLAGDLYFILKNNAENACDGCSP